MRRISSLVLVLLVLLGLARVLAAPPQQGARADSQSPPARDEASALTAQDVRVNAMTQRGQLSVRSVEPDLVLPGHQHERFDQYVDGVRVFGGDITRQSVDGTTTSIFGTFYDGIAIGTTPTVTAEAARATFAAMNGAELPSDRPVELVILPRDDGSFALAWRTHVRTNGKWLQTFLDANTGAVLLQYNDMQTQAAVGTGTGVLGDAKKISDASAERPLHRRRPAAPAVPRHLRREGQRDARRKLARRRIARGERHGQRRRQRVDGSRERGRPRQRRLDLRLLLQDVRPPRPERSRRADSLHLASREPIGSAERVGRRGRRRTTSTRSGATAAVPAARE